MGILLDVIEYIVRKPKDYGSFGLVKYQINFVLE